MKKFLGTSLWEAIEVWWIRLIGCDHPDNMQVDLGDADRGSDWHCMKCQRSYKELRGTEIIDSQKPTIIQEKK